MPEDPLQKKYYRIKDVAEIIGVPQSTLRFWETEFPQCAPKRNRSNVRYYTPENIETLRVIHYLLKIKGLKLEAAKEQLKVNKENVFKRQEIIDRLTRVRDELESLMLALNKRK